MKVYNLSRQEAKNWQEEIDGIWISIGEPTEDFQHISNPILDKLPTLKLCFWDVDKIQYRPIWRKDDGTWLEEEFHPPTMAQARQIVDFILDNPGKDVVAQCQAGYSRSGGIAKFCEELGYKWGYCKDRAQPNALLFKLMKAALNPASIEDFSLIGQ